MGGKVGGGEVAQGRKANECSRYRPELGDGKTVPRDGINQGSGERVGNWEGGRRGNPVFKRESRFTVSVFSDNPVTNGVTVKIGKALPTT
jgi:hypothetical protein